MSNFEFRTPPPTYSPPMGFNNYGYHTNQYMTQPTYQTPIMINIPPIQTSSSFIPHIAPGYCTPPMMAPPMMNIPPLQTAASFIPQTTPGYCTPPPMMMSVTPPTAASFIPSYNSTVPPTTSPGYGVTPDLIIPFGNPHYKY